MCGRGEAHTVFWWANVRGRDHLEDLRVNMRIILKWIFVPGSSVSIATELRDGRSGIENQWGRDFPAVQTDTGSQPASCKMGTGSFPGGKVRPGRAADHSPPSSAAVMEE